MTRQQWQISIVTAVILGVGAVALFTHLPSQTQRNAGGRFRGGDGPVPVLVAPAKLTDVPIYFDGVGTTKALNTVTVRSQVDGKLISVAFNEGQDVNKGYVLARIDPTLYQAAYDQAVAKKAQDEAQLSNARRDLERYKRLAETNAGSRQQADTQAATVAQLEAQVKSDQAAIDNAKGILEYTNVVAPIDGRTGLRQVDEGNIVHASDATGIVVLTQLKPISIVFSVPQQQLDRIKKAFAQNPLPVDAMGSDGKTVSDHGTLQVIDNQVDPTTGTVKMKADFPNADIQLWPGQFVNVRLLVDTLKQVVTIPTSAVQRGANGPFVYVVAPAGDVVAMRPVTVPQQDETQAVIATGLKADERVVTTGFSRLADGGRITITINNGSNNPASPGAEKPNRRATDPNAASDPARPAGRRRGQNSGGAPSSAP